MSEYFLKLKSLEANVKDELNLSKNATNVKSKFSSFKNLKKLVKQIVINQKKYQLGKIDSDKLEKVPAGLSSLKSKVDKLDVDTLVPVPVDLTKLCDVVANFVKKDK